MEMIDEGPLAINDQEVSPDNNINKNDLPTAKVCEK